MAKKRVPLHQNPRGFVDVDPDATNGAQVGVNLRGPDGQILTAAQVINPTGGSSGGPSSIASTIWKLIREVPSNIQKLAALIGAGFAARQSNGDWALRTLQEGTGIDIANPDGDAGNPTISLADLANSGAGAALVKITRDAKGRVSGTQSATTDDLPAGSTNKYFPEAPTDGQQYARQSGAWTVVTASGGGFVPYNIPDGQSFLVPLNQQALFTLPINLGDGSSIVLDGALVEVS